MSGEITLPHKSEIERIVLGAAMLRDDLTQIELIRRELEPNAFTVPFHREALLALFALAERGESLNPVVLQSEMEARGSNYKDLPVRIAELTNGVPALSNLKAEIRKLKEVFTVREIMRSADAWLTEAQHRDVDMRGLARAISKRAADFEDQFAEPETDDFALEPGFYMSLKELHDEQTEPADYVLVGVRRRQVSLFLSVTNVGKSTILLNHCLAAAAAKTWAPLLPDAPARPLKVIYIDGESTDDELKQDTNTMLRTIGGRDDALVNFIPVVEAAIKGESLDLSNKEHFKFVKAYVKAQQPDILVIDTIGSLFTLYNENDNAEVKRKVIRPLRELAATGNCGVIGSHHIGKRGENTTDEEESYLGRGASAFGSDTRAVFTLKREKSLGDGYVRLTLGKAKGVRFDPVALKLDFAGRTFDICAAAPKVETPYQRVVGIFNGQPLKRAAILELLPDFSAETVDRQLRDAVRTGDLTKQKNGREVEYKKPDSRQSCHPYRDDNCDDYSEMPENIEDSLDFLDTDENDRDEYSDSVLDAIAR